MVQMNRIMGVPLWTAKKISVNLSALSYRAISINVATSPAGNGGTDSGEPMNWNEQFCTDFTLSNGFNCHEQLDVPKSNRRRTHMADQKHLDPVCGMTVEESPTAITLDYKEATYYFCGSGCRSAFEKDAEQYLKTGHGTCQC